jgi:hypothetical protein
MLPFNRYELKEGGAEVSVTLGNLREYVRLVAEHLLIKSIGEQVMALAQGIEDVFPLEALRCFSPEELQVEEIYFLHYILFLS